MEKKYRRVSTAGLAKKYNFRAYRSSFNGWFRSCLQGAMRRDLDFVLTLRQAYELSQGQCYYCGRSKVNKTQDFRYVGLDRIDNNKGYTFDNVVSCCKTCNAMKGKMPMAEFIEQAKRIADHE